MKVEKYEQLEIWKKGIEVVQFIYILTNKGKFSTDFSLRDQMRRSAISIPSNISEGFERNSNKEFKRFLLIAKGSAGELRTQLYIAFRLDYLSHVEFKTLNEKVVILSKQISAFINYLKVKV
jgi:four helix bundle protein